MTAIHRSAFVPFSPAQMFDLVNNIEQYPHFLPWCADSQVLSRSEQEIQATLHIAKGGFSKSFTTANRLIPNERVEMRLLEGPFSQFEGIWRFAPIADQGSQVTLNLSFEFDNKLLAFTLGPLFHHIASTLVESFTQRADKVYATALHCD